MVRASLNTFQKGVVHHKAPANRPQPSAMRPTPQCYDVEGYAGLGADSVKMMKLKQKTGKVHLASP